MIKTKPLYINILLTVLAISLHSYLTHKYFLLQNGEATGQSLCNVNSYLNCDAVNSSPYSRMLGNPMALWGLVTHLVFLFAQILVAVKQDAQDYWTKITAYTSVLIAVTSVVMGTISFMQIGSLCLFCITAYLLSFLNILFLKLAGISYSDAFKNFKDVLLDRTTWILAVSVPVLVFMIGKNWGGPANSKELEGFVQDRYAAWKASSEYKFDENLGLRLGAAPQDAKMTIIEFADFRCPHCKHAAPSVEAFVQSRKDVALIFKAYPLDGKCNLDPSFGGQGDGISCRLAFGVFCAEKLDQKGWHLYNTIFENQTDYHNMSTIDQVDAELCKSGVSDCAKFKTCMDDESTRVMIQQMAQEGTQAGLKGTPTFYVNKRLLNGGQLPKVLERVYEDIKGQ